MNKISFKIGQKDVIVDFIYLHYTLSHKQTKKHKYHQKYGIYQLYHRCHFQKQFCSLYIIIIAAMKKLSDDLLKLQFILAAS